MLFIGEVVDMDLSNSITRKPPAAQASHAPMVPRGRTGARQDA